MSDTITIDLNVTTDEEKPRRMNINYAGLRTRLLAKFGEKTSDEQMSVAINSFLDAVSSIDVMPLFGGNPKMSITRDGDFIRIDFKEEAKLNDIIGVVHAWSYFMGRTAAIIEMGETKE